MKNKIKALLFTLAAIAGLGIGNARASHSPFCKDHYYNSDQFIKAFEKGKVKFSNGMTELDFVNVQIRNINNGLAQENVLDTNGYLIQLPTFNSISKAKPYFIELLQNHTRDNESGWEKGEYLLGRIDDETDAVKVDWERKSNPGETFIELDPNTLPGVNQADGDYNQIPAFSLWCCNLMARPKKPKPVERPAIARKEEPKEEKKPLSPVYEPIETNWSSSNSMTYGTGNNVSIVNNVEGPKNPNLPYIIQGGIAVLAMAKDIYLTREMMNNAFNGGGYYGGSFNSGRSVMYEPLNQNQTSFPIEGNTGNPPPGVIIQGVVR